jgi:hypothetical protein
MRKSFAFRTSVAETLEVRLVMSRLGVATHVGAPGHPAPATPQAKATSKVTEAFSNFAQDFTLAVNNDLELPVMMGTGTSSGNAPLFMEQLGQDLTTLERSVLKAPGHVPAGAPLVSQVRELIIGPGANSLMSRLTGLTTSSLAMGSSLASYENVALEEARQTYARVNKDVVASLQPSPSAVPAQSASSVPTQAG